MSRWTMAGDESNEEERNNPDIPCRFYALGSCRSGSSCHFSHSASPNNLLCPFKAKKTCHHGDRCIFSHGSSPASSRSNPVPTTNSTAASSSSTAATSTPSSSTMRLTSLVRLDANAPEFVPRAAPATTTSRSWAQITQSSLSPSSSSSLVASSASSMTVSEAESELCPFNAEGQCPYGYHCEYIHGLQCELCDQFLIHPHHQLQQRHHKEACLKQHEADMEHSFAVALSRDKTCGICMEVVMDKPKGEARFGILPNCNHCFCVSCIRKWRKAKEFENSIVRACPECRQTSDFICPSRLWVEGKEEKETLFVSYKRALNEKECKYFRRGEGNCPFGNKCFYKHLSKEGVHVDVGPPRGRRTIEDSEGELSSVPRFLLYDYLSEREGQIVIIPEYLDLLDLISENSDQSEVAFSF